MIKVKSIVLICLNSGKNKGGFCKIFLIATIKNDKLNNNQIIESIEKPFLQVEISQIDVEGGSQRTSIHKYLEHFYVEGNKLFDKNFLKWYLQEYYAIELGGNYILHIIDTDINMFELKPNEFIKLKNKKEQNKLYTVMNTTE